MLLPVVVVGGVLVVALLVWVAVTYNGLVRLRNRTEDAWSGIDVQLQRRADLVPQLVATVQGYAGHEEGVLLRVTQARTAILDASGPASAGAADDALEQALGGLFAVAEGYPELRASENYLQLQRDLAVLEEEISFARRYHNATVEQLNTGIETFPSMLVARPFGFRRREYFKADAADRVVPQVGGR